MGKLAERLFKSGPPLLIGSLLCVYVIIAVAQLRAQRSYDAPTTSELGRESARQSAHIDNMELSIGAMGVEQAAMKQQLNQLIAVQVELNSKIDRFFWMVLAMSLKMLFDLSKDLLFMRRSKANGSS